MAIVTTEADLGAYGAVDCGVYLGMFMLAAHSLGLATIAQASIARHSPYLRKRLSLPSDRLVVFAISLGYADPDHPTAKFRTSRGLVGEAVTFMS